MATRITIKRGDTLTPITATHTVDGSEADLTSYDVYCYFKFRGSSVRREMTKLAQSGDTLGQATYTFTAADWAGSDFPAGSYSFETDLVDGDGKVRTHPNSGVVVVVIEGDLGDPPS